MTIAFSIESFLIALKDTHFLRNTELKAILFYLRNLNIDYNLFLKDLYVVQETSCSIDRTGNLYVLLTTVNKEDFFQTNRWGTPSSRLMYMVCDPQYNILKLEPVLSEDSELTWLPNLGKSNRENQFFIFMQGNNSSGNLEKVKNKLWFGWIGWE